MKFIAVCKDNFVMTQAVLDRVKIWSGFCDKITSNNLLKGKLKLTFYFGTNFLLKCRNFLK